jgi:hypothetical protein
MNGSTINPTHNAPPPMPSSAASRRGKLCTGCAATLGKTAVCGTAATAKLFAPIPVRGAICINSWLNAISACRSSMARGSKDALLTSTRASSSPRCDHAMPVMTAAPTKPRKRSERPYCCRHGLCSPMRTAKKSAPIVAPNHAEREKVRTNPAAPIKIIVSHNPRCSEVACKKKTAASNMSIASTPPRMLGWGVMP